MLSRYKELDALRGIAALFVVLYHFTMGRQQSELGFNLGVTGVDLFFIISGFVIFMSINKVSTSLEFFINRFSRLFPTYWFCVTFTFFLRVAVVLSTSDLPLKDIPFLSYLGNLTMFQHYLQIKDIDGPYWTMIVEMLFYICIAIIFSLKKIEFIIPVGLSILIVSIINDVWIENYYPVTHKIHTLFPLITHFPLFLAGILFYKLMNVKYGPHQKLFLFFCLFACFATKLMLFDDGGQSVGIVSFTQYLFMLSGYFLLFILFISGKLSFIVSGPTLFLGKISFALYLVHQFVSVHVIIPGLIKYVGVGFWLAALITLPIIILLATAITYNIEIPVGKKIKSFLRGALLQNKQGEGIIKQNDIDKAKRSLA